ncbi:unnamed protein product, partial [Ectocarpus sp. 8 AP-2014]
AVARRGSAGVPGDAEGGRNGESQSAGVSGVKSQAAAAASAAGFEERPAGLTSTHDNVGSAAAGHNALSTPVATTGTTMAAGSHPTSAGVAERQGRADPASMGQVISTKGGSGGAAAAAEETKALSPRPPRAEVPLDHRIGPATPMVQEAPETPVARTEQSAQPTTPAGRRLGSESVSVSDLARAGSAAPGDQSPLRSALPEPEALNGDDDSAISRAEETPEVLDRNG